MARKLTLWYAIVIHAVWGAAMLADPTVADTATLTLLREYCPNTYVLAVLLLIVAVCAIAACSMPLSRWSLALLLPQQFVLLCSSFDAIRTIAVGHFPTGPERSTLWMTAVLSPTILLGVFYSAAIWQICGSFTRRRPSASEQHDSWLPGQSHSPR